MENGGEIILAALALVLVIEGLAYALFPDGIKRMLLAIREVPAPTLQLLGLAAALTGVILFWFIRR